MRRLTLIALAIGATAVLAACGGSNADALTGKNWQLTSITGEVAGVPGRHPAGGPGEVPDHVHHRRPRSAGRADCNQIGGTYKTSGRDRIEITPGHLHHGVLPRVVRSTPCSFTRSRQASTLRRSRTTQLTITLTDGGTLELRRRRRRGLDAGRGRGSHVAAAAQPTRPRPRRRPPRRPRPPTAAPTAAPTADPTTAPTAAPTATPTASRPRPRPRPRRRRRPPAPTAGPDRGPGPRASSAGCGSSPPSPRRTRSFQGVVPGGTAAQLHDRRSMADGTFSAKADCNTVAGAYTTADAAAASGDLTLAPGPTTLVGLRGRLVLRPVHPRR